MAYVLPIASPNTLGGIMVGDRLNITDDGVLNVDLSDIESTLKQSATDVQQGKQAIASSLTNKGSPSTADETLKTYANKIDGLNISKLGVCLITPYAHYKTRNLNSYATNYEIKEVNL